MRSGVKTKEIVTGEGDEAVPTKTVAANVRFFLNRGTEITGALIGGPRMVIDLKQRECIAGLRYGIVGMRVGGRREITVSPHLAYGPAGVPGHIPPNAVIRCEVELLDVREHGVRKAEDYPPGKHLFVFHPGEAARNEPRWQFGLQEDGRCGITITHPIPGMTWRHSRHSQKVTRFEMATTQSLFEHALRLQELFPKDCFRNEELWADTAEQGNAITRHKTSNDLCLTIGVMERGQWVAYVSLAETSRAALDSPLLKRINAILGDNSGNSTVE